MKKLLTIGLMALAMTFMAAACNSTKAEEPDTNAVNTEVVETEVDTNAAEVVDSADTVQL